MKLKSPDELKKAYRFSIFYAILMIASLFVFAFIVGKLQQNSAQFEKIASAPAVDILRYVLIGVSIINFFYIRFRKNKILKGSFADKTRIQIVFSRKTSFPPSVQGLINASIVANTLCVSVAIYGVVLFFITRSTIDYYIFMAISLILFIIYFPRYSQWEEWMRKYERNVDHANEVNV